MFIKNKADFFFQFLHTRQTYWNVCLLRNYAIELIFDFSIKTDDFSEVFSNVLENFIFLRTNSVVH